MDVGQAVPNPCSSSIRIGAQLSFIPTLVYSRIVVFCVLVVSLTLSASGPLFDCAPLSLFALQHSFLSAYCFYRQSRLMDGSYRATAVAEEQEQRESTPNFAMEDALDVKEYHHS